MDAPLLCHDERRRSDVRASEFFNGFDYVEMEDAGGGNAKLRVFLLANDAAAAGTLETAQFLITGGRRVPQVAVLAADYVAGSKDTGHSREQRDDTIELTVQRPDDLSTYTLCLVRAPQRPVGADDLFDSFDPRYSAVQFSFAAGEVSELDCARPVICPPEPVDEPAIDYLARDYPGLRRLLFDRFALILPEWRRRPVPDQFVAAVEVLAYLGDRVSYHQDAVGTEAYLGTARKRISIRRHVRLVDCLMHEGCNARAFVCVCGPDSQSIDPQALAFLTVAPAARLAKGRQVSTVSSADPLAAREVFLPLLPEPPQKLRSEDIYDWRALVRKTREMLPPEGAAPALALRHTGRHRTTLEKAWVLLPMARRELLRGEGFDPHDHALQSAFDRWIAASEDPAYDPTQDADLHRAADAWFYLQRIGLRLPGTLRTDLAGDFDPYDPERQRALLDGLNRALRDRGLAESLAAATDAEVWKHNRDEFQKIFPRALAEPGKLRFFAAHQTMFFHTWGDQECCLPRGATHGTLVDTFADPAPVRAAAQTQTSTTANQQPCPPPPPRPPVDRPRALHLRVGDVLIFEEVLGPTTGLPADASPARRHAVLLTRVVPRLDPLYDQPIVEIEWAGEDALPFPLCVSVRGPADAKEPCRPIANVSVARGNVVLADHGRRIVNEPVGKVPIEALAAQCRCEGELADPVTHPGRFTTQLAKSELTFAEPPEPLASAARALVQEPRRALPGVRLTSIGGGPDGEKPLFDWRELADVSVLAARLARAVEADPADPVDPRPWQLLGRLTADVRAKLADTSALPSEALTQLLERFKYGWEPRFDLLESGPADRHFVVEMDEKRTAHLRFGSGGLGCTPEAGAIFSADYRVGNGPAGNVGADRITDVRLNDQALAGFTARNPLPAKSGTAPESTEEVRRRAPFAFQRPLERAITAEDYATLAMQCPHAPIQRAAAEIAPAGATRKVTVAIDPRGQEIASAALLATMKAWLEPRRRIGHQVEVVTAKLVSLQMTLSVNVQPHYEPAHVKEALLEIFGYGLRSNGQPGFFHPDQLTFGQPIRLSVIVAKAQAVTGVTSVEVGILKRLPLVPGDPDLPADGLLPFGTLEIARLDNDPAFPENGVLKIETKGLL